MKALAPVLPVERCHWCQCIMWREFRLPHQTRGQRRTIDHIKCKAECQTHAEYVAPANKVAACYTCNQRRNELFIAAHPGAKPSWKPAPATPGELAARARGRALRRARRGPVLGVAEGPIKAFTY